MKNIIIGKESNLSNQIFSNLNNSIIISSRNILGELKLIDNEKNYKLNIIINSFQPSTSLNDLSNPIDYINNSILVSSIILNKIKNFKINKVLYTSSSSVYGNNKLCNENDQVKPDNLHSSLKLANEKLIESFCIKNNIDYTIARIFNMYGANDKFSIISKLISSVKDGNIINLINNGQSVRDYIFIEDVVKIYKILLERNDIKTINIGSGIGHSVLDIIRIIKKYGFNIQTKNIYADEIKISIAAIEKLSTIIDTSKFLKLDTYIKDTLK
ncbi:MAG: NAD(P)-dependent oxidoreductase [Candidatus Sericytochromatia bacterium]